MAKPPCACPSTTSGTNAWPHSSTLYAFAIRNTPVARSISMRTSVPHNDEWVGPLLLRSVGGYFTLERSRRANLPPPRRTARASMSAVHACPEIVKVACANAQRLKQCVIAPVTPLRACAFAATAGNASGANPGMTSCPSFHRAVFHSFALGSFGAMPHSSSAAGHRPKRKMTRAASAAACVMM